MRPFSYEMAASVPQAVATMAAHPHARYLAGGTNLVDLMKLGVEQPDVLIDLSRLPLDGIEVSPRGDLLIGAGVRNSDLAGHPAVRRIAPVVARAVLAGASGQLRNMATVGGNLLQQTRCPWFQDVRRPCNKRQPGSGCSALEGDNRMHAILGTTDDCIAVHPSDFAVGLIAMDANVRAETSAGTIAMPLRALYPSVGADPSRHTELPREALITAVEIPVSLSGGRDAYRKVRDRASYAFALVSIAAVVAVDDGTITDVRLAFGGVAPFPWRASRAEAVLRGGPATVAQFAAAARAELHAATLRRHNAFKATMLQNVLVATLAELCGVAR